ncbi:MAG: YraN family protein [Bacteroidales bacterium]|nr:YraN family protein [Bacteroidales bacterium]MBO5769087.1 YraN family protein [Bacteroidales bacterium]MBO5916995.1 YraN family protein [Bacteroidales bacterium]MBO7323855.1 YraN family protein [Bacteroidales bacterium]
MATHNRTGRWGEDIALTYLEKKAYRILERNWHAGHKELDIIALDGNTLVIVEVKTRSGDDYEEPWQAVTSLKIKRIVQAANLYIRQKAIDAEVRFDIVSVVMRPDGQAEIEHIEDAFTAPLS